MISHVIQVILILLGLMLVCMVILGLAAVGRHPQRNLKVVIPIIFIMVLAAFIDVSYQQTIINSIGIIAFKSYLPAHRPGQSHYAFFVVRGNRYWLFRVNESTFKRYHRDDRIRLVKHCGILSGHIYKTTLY